MTWQESCNKHNEEELARMRKHLEEQKQKNANK